MIHGDSLEYEFLENAVKALSNPIGVSVEIGVRKGYGSAMIINSYRKYHPKIDLVHLGIDPYGNIEYMTEENRKVRLDYTNKMKQECIKDFADIPEFHMVNLEDTEFFKRFADGYPIYNEYKKMITEYEIVHFDGPHDLKSVINEVEFFAKRLAPEAVFIFDDIKNFDIDKVGKTIIDWGFKEYDKGERKRSFIYKA